MKPVNHALFSIGALTGALALATTLGCARAGADEEPTAPSAQGGAGGSNVGGDDGFGGIDPGTGCGELPADAVEGVSPAVHDTFEQTAGSSPAFVFDPPSGAVLPEGWPSPTFLAHTDTLPGAVQLRLELGNGQELRYTAEPTAAVPSHGDSAIDGVWWTLRLPTSTWSAARCTSSTMSWTLLYLGEGDAAPAGVASGTLRLLADVDDPDMTYLGMEQPPTLGTPSSYSIERLAVQSGSSQKLVESGNDHCIGCHTSSPDGMDLIYQEPGSAGWNVDVVRPLGDGDVEPSPVVGSAAAEILATTMLMMPGASAAAWSDETGHWLSAVTSEGRAALLQLDAGMSTTSALHLAPLFPGKSLVVASPVLAPDASRLVMVATDSMIDGYFDQGTVADLWQVPVTLAKDTAPVFGEPTPLPEASGTDFHETHPSFSADGALITFTRTAPGSRGYDEESAEIWVMPADGSAPPTRLASNDAPTSSSVYTGEGLTSSWSRFGETSVTTSEGTWYFVLFSSRRGSGQLWEDRSLGSNYIPGRPVSRLYFTPLLRHDDGTIESFPAVLVPGQRPSTGAHTATFVSVTSVDPPPPPVE